MQQYVVRPARAADAQAYVGCHLECLAETYRDVMPPAFFQEQRRAGPASVGQLRQDLDAPADAAAPPATAWLALDPLGGVVGVARSAASRQHWEDELGAPAAPVALQLQHIYTRRSTHGTGLGQALLDAAVGGRDAYLWILGGNARAERFYRRNGFRPDGVQLLCGPTWFYRPQFRMVRVRG